MVVRSEMTASTSCSDYGINDTCLNYSLLEIKTSPIFFFSDWLETGEVRINMTVNLGC